MKKVDPSDSFFKTFVHQCNDLVVITDNEAKIVYVNPAFEKHTGYQLHKIKNKNISLVKSGLHNNNFYTRLWAKLKEGKPTSAVFINRKKNGELYYENKTITPIIGSNNSITYYLSTSKDVTSELRLQREIVKQKNLIQSVIQNTDTIIVGLNENFEISVFNKAAEQITGYFNGQLENRNLLTLVNKSDLKIVTEALVKACKIQSRYEFRLKPLKGRSRLISWSITHLQDDPKEAGLILATGIDITRERESERKLREMNSELDKKVKQKTGRLKSLNEKILEQNKFISKINSELPAIVYIVDLKKQTIRLFNNKINDHVIIPLQKNKDIELNSFLKHVKLEKTEAKKYFTEPVQEAEIPFIIKETTFWFQNRSVIFQTNDSEKPKSILGFITDITNTRFIQDRLKDSQRIAKLGNWEWDVTSDKIYWSEEIYNIFGLAQNEFDPSYPRFLDAIHPADRRLVEQSVTHALKTKSPYEITHRIITPGGTIKHVTEKGYAEYSKSGKPLRMVGTVQDISEENALREDLKSAYVTLQNSLNAVITSDLEGKIQFANDAAIKMWKFESLEEMKKEEGLLSDFLQEDIFHTNDNQPELIKTGFYYSPAPVFTKRKSGEKMAVKYNLSVIKDSFGKPQSITGAFFDVTSQLETEKKIKEYDTKINMLLGNIDEVVFGVDAKNGSLTGGDLFFLSARSKEIMGFSLQELKDNPALWFNQVHKDDLKNIFQSNLTSITERKTVTRNYRLRLRDTGKHRWFEEKITPHYDENGNIQSFYGSARDVTERIQAELLLKEREEKYRSLFQNILVGILRVNISDMRPLEANDVVVSLFGFPDSEAFYQGFVFSDFPMQPYLLDDIIYELRNNSTLTNQKVKLRKYNSQEYFWGQINARIVAGGNTLEMVILDVTENHNYEERLRKNLAEKEMLLKEVHHRVKNNLQIICSLLRLQLNKIENPVLRQPLIEGYERIHSIALIHEKLYLSQNLETINFSEYLTSLIQTMVNLHPEKEIITNFKTQNFETNINTAIPLGLMCFEIVSNSFKHAYRNISGNRLDITIQKQDNTTRLQFRDNGEGFDTNQLMSTKTLGWKLIKNLANQAKANVQIDSKNDVGTTITISLSVESN